MKFSKKNVKTLRTLIIAVLAVALILVMVIAFSPKSPKNSTGGNGTNIPTVTVKTPYCDLEYPKQWKDQMTVKETAVDGVLAESFYAVIAGTEYELYTVYFGNSEKGELFGFIPYEGKDTPVYIECHRVPEESGLTDEEITLFYTMMEGVNETTQSISSAPGFEKS